MSFAVHLRCPKMHYLIILEANAGLLLQPILKKQVNLTIVITKKRLGNLRFIT